MTTHVSEPEGLLMHSAVEETRRSVEVGKVGYSFGWGRQTDDDSTPPENQLTDMDVNTVICEPLPLPHSVEKSADAVWPSGAPRFICSKPSASTALCSGDFGGTKPSEDGQGLILHS